MTNALLNEGISEKKKEMFLLDLDSTVLVAIIVSFIWLFVAPLLGLRPKDPLTTLMTQQIVNKVTRAKYHSIKNQRQDFITVYAFRVSSLGHDLNKYQRGQYETTGKESRSLCINDNYCCICKCFIGNMYRRILHESNSECYVCYRERLFLEDIQVFMLLSHVDFQGVPSEIRKLIYWDFYMKLRMEKLVVTPAPGLDTDLKIPQFHYILMHFPRLKMPEWVDDKMVWGYNFHNQSYYTGFTFDMNLWLRNLPRRLAKNAWEILTKELNSLEERTLPW